MNNPIVIFSLDSIIECWFDYCFLKNYTCLLYTSDAADEEDSVDLGGRRIIKKINNPIFIFSLDSIIECWFDYCFLKIYTFHKSRSEFCFSLYFLRVDRESSAGKFWSSNPNKLLHVLHFATSSQCNRPDLLENTMAKLRSVQWLVDFNPWPLSVWILLAKPLKYFFRVKIIHKLNKCSS